MKNKSNRTNCFLLCLVLIGLFGCQASNTQNSGLLAASINQAEKNLPPELNSAIVSIDAADSKKAIGENFMVVTANAHATEAAKNILLQGGTAIDAAIAAQLVLGLVEPQSSGIGGGGFLLHWDAQQKLLKSYDGRETAPLSVDENLFFNPQLGQEDKFFDAVLGGKSVGVPGLIKMLELAHQQHGALPWKALFNPAIDLSNNGFAVSERLNALLRLVPLVDQRTIIKNYFFDDQGVALAIGSRLKNPEYARSLMMIAEQGSSYFYRGELSKKIIEATEKDDNAGYLTTKDFSGYNAVQRVPVCQEIFSHRLCGMGPPSSGGTTVLSILSILELLTDPSLADSGQQLDNNPLLAHYFIEASRLAFADRNTYLADPDFISVPVQQLLAADYLSSRAKLINPVQAMAIAKPGKLTRPLAHRYITQASPELESTSHLSIVDRYGNAVSMTSSIETAFGSRLMVDGFLLNNQLTDFSFTPRDGNKRLVANRVQGGKRPRSSMSPMIIFDRNSQPILIIGSPGGKRIIPYVAGFIYEVLGLGRSPQSALSRPHITNIGRGVEIEQGTPAALIDSLTLMGHSPKVKYQTSGLHIIYRQKGQWLGLADPRREGVSAGD